MKSYKFFILLFGLFFSLPVWSLIMDDVGAIDSFLTSEDLGNSGKDPESWIEGYLGFDITLTSQYDSAGSDWTLIDGESDVYATELDDTPDYFFIKIGTGGTSSLVSHYLFENIGDLSWAVVDFSEANIDFSIQNISIDRMSHVGEVNGSTSVPEPSIIALFGFGLIILGFRSKNILPF